MSVEIDHAAYKAVYDWLSSRLAAAKAVAKSIPMALIDERARATDKWEAALVVWEEFIERFDPVGGAPGL